MAISKFDVAKSILYLEIIFQVVVIFTEAVSNSIFKKHASELGVDYSGQSVLVIIIAVILIFITLLMGRHLKYVIIYGAIRVTISCICLSIASLVFRGFSCWLFLSLSDPNYLPTYNITTVCIILGAVTWIPLWFCGDPNYNDNSATIQEDRDRITSTNGPPPVFRPNQGDDDELPSYYEMISPPAYKHKNTLASAS